MHLADCGTAARAMTARQPPSTTGACSAACAATFPRTHVEGYCSRRSAHGHVSTLTAPGARGGGACCVQAPVLRPCTHRFAQAVVVADELPPANPAPAAEANAALTAEATNKPCREPAPGRQAQAPKLNGAGPTRPVGKPEAGWVSSGRVGVESPWFLLHRSHGSGRTGGAAGRGSSWQAVQARPCGSAAVLPPSFRELCLVLLWLRQAPVEEEEAEQRLDAGPVLPRDDQPKRKARRPWPHSLESKLSFLSILRRPRGRGRRKSLPRRKRRRWSFLPRQRTTGPASATTPWRPDLGKTR